MGRTCVYTQLIAPTLSSLTSGSDRILIIDPTDVDKNTAVEPMDVDEDFPVESIADVPVESGHA
ncbi:hypothetical protein BGZ72_003652 [Mortierella alpina]|nr:hypothetical protein BGZ72_003652 [Mortierella alpina]